MSCSQGDEEEDGGGDLIEPFGAEDQGGRFGRGQLLRARLALPRPQGGVGKGTTDSIVWVIVVC